jgi:hypothetical protein
MNNTSEFKTTKKIDDENYMSITISDYNYELEKQENKFNYYIDIYNTNSDEAIDTLIFDDLRQLINYLQ